MKKIIAPKGMGMYIWDILRLIDHCGSNEAIADLLVKGGIEHALVKVANGVYASNQQGNVDLVAPLITALRAREIQVWGWHYVYGEFYDAEAQRSLEMIERHRLNGFVINAEVEYKYRTSQAVSYVLALQAGAPDVTLALSSHRFPTYHREFPWEQFLSRVDLNMPQVYWIGAHNPSSQLRRCVAEFQSGDWPACPIIPTGAAFRDNQTIDPDTGDWWEASEADVAGFINTAREIGYNSMNFWELGNTLLFVPELWDVIKSLTEAGNDEEPEDEDDDPSDGGETGGNEVDWSKFAIARSVDQFDEDLKDAVFISVGSPFWINEDINAQVTKAKAKGLPYFAIYAVDVEVYTQIFNEPESENWDQEHDPYYSGYGNYGAYLRGMVKNKGFSAIMFDIRNVKKSAEAWIRGVLSYLRRLSKDDLGVPIYYIIADEETYTALGPQYTGNTNMNDFLQNCGSNAIICPVDLNGEYPADGAVFFYGPAPEIDWILYGPGMWLYKLGDKDKLYSDLGFIPDVIEDDPGDEEEPGQEEEPDDENPGGDGDEIVDDENPSLIKRFIQALIAALQKFLEYWLGSGE